MKIDQSNVLLNSQWSTVQQYSEKGTIQFWNQNQNINTEKNIFIDISDEGKALSQSGNISKSTNEDEYGVELSDKDKEKIKLLEDFIYVLTGKHIKFKVIDKIKINKENKLESLKIHNGQNLSVGQPQGWGLRIDYNESTYQSEKMSFSSKGTVKTADGREINFNLDFSVSREFYETRSLSIRAGDALIDPLIINFKNASASLGDRNYFFDIDFDGNKDTIAFTAAGSGFLALDKNNNNIIDDGSELFGPQSGDGFKELSAYDNDSNGWIDENDATFDKLRIWTLNDNGDKELIALGVAGVGAIYLGNIQSQFGLKTSSNETLGQIQQTGIFLKESGEAGTIQHVNLAV